MSTHLRLYSSLALASLWKGQQENGEQLKWNVFDFGVFVTYLLAIGSRCSSKDQHEWCFPLCSHKGTFEEVQEAEGGEKREGKEELF